MIGTSVFFLAKKKMEVNSQLNKEQMTGAKSEANPVADHQTTTRNSTVSQFVSCVSVLLIQLVPGIAMGYSSALIPALEADDSDLHQTRDQTSWIASVFTIAMPFGSLLGGWMMNAFGRLKSCQLNTIPMAAAWVIIATAQSFEQLIAGRIILGACGALQASVAFLYIAEVAEKSIRGVLGCMGSSFSSLGVLVAFAVGAYVPWRVAAWIYAVAPLVLLAVTLAVSSESPVWLREKGKDSAARNVSKRFYHDPEKVLSSPKDADRPAQTSVWGKLGTLFKTSSGLKPFIMMNILFLGQAFSGIYVIIFFAVTFFEESGNDLDPYIATIVIGVLRLVFSTIIALTASSLGRRPALLASTIGMGVSMVGSGWATQGIFQIRKEGGVPEQWLSWAVVVCILLFVVFSTSGLTILPWSMMAEVFPHDVRGVAQPLNMAISTVYAFAGLQVYPTLATWLGGSAGVQFFFAGTSFFMAVFVWAFVVETRGLTLEEIEEYFSKNIFYPGHKSRQEKLEKCKS